MRLPVASTRTVIRRLLGIFQDHGSEFVWLLVFQLAAAIAGVIAPMMIGRAINAVSAGTTVRFIVSTIITVLAVAGVQVALTYVASYRAQIFGQKVFTQLRNGVIHSVTHLPLETVEAAGTGDLLGRTTNDVDRVRYFVEDGLSRFIVAVTTVVVTLTAAIVTSPQVGVVILVVAVPLPLVLRWYLRRATPSYLANSAIGASVDGVVSETVEQATTVDALSLGRTRLSRLDTLVAETVNSEVYTSFLRIGFNWGVLATVYSPVVIALLWGGYLTGTGAVSLGATTTVVMYCLQIAGPLQGISWLMDEAQFAGASLARIFGVDNADRGPERDEMPAGQNLEIRDVCFTYEVAERNDLRGGAGPEAMGEPAPDSAASEQDFAAPGAEVAGPELEASDEVLHHVTLDIRPGETLAIVGPSGAGKSTLGRLIAGINPPSAGWVQIGGADVSKIPESVLHREVALVTQEHHVFVGTVADNLRLANEAATEVEMREASRTVELEVALDEQLGSGARILTPAQAQQLALARIVLLDPQVLVLDEATSLLDPTAARSTERAMARVLRGRTVIAIAHRLYTAHDADRVAVMENGRVVELGSHDELVTRGGQYASLWETWQRS